MKDGTRSAIISEDNVYRYALGRQWTLEKPDKAPSVALCGSC